MLNSAVIEEKKFKHSLRVWGAHNPLGPNVNRKASLLWSFVASLKKESLQPLTLYTSFHDLINVYSHRSGANNPRGPGDRMLMSTETSCHLDHLLQV